MMVRKSLVRACAARGGAVLAAVALAACCCMSEAQGSSLTALPPGGVYTCAWIAANPTAATLVRVSCNPSGVNPGSAVTPADVAAVTPLGTGCQRVPSAGAIGHLVYASTTPEYSSSWSWSSSSRDEPFYWYIKHTDGSNQAYGYSLVAGGGLGVPPNVYYWEVQNQGADARYWDPVCWSG